MSTGSLPGRRHAEAICAKLSRLLGAGESGAAKETFWAIRQFFEARGRERPFVVVLDDIHWGEETFLDLTEHVADWSRAPRSCCFAWRARTCWTCVRAFLDRLNR